MLSKDLEFKVQINVAEASKDIKLEDHLWDTHSHVNGWYRRELEAVRTFSHSTVRSLGILSPSTVQERQEEACG